jgi:hypothetical protein
MVQWLSTVRRVISGLFFAVGVSAAVAGLGAVLVVAGPWIVLGRAMAPAGRQAAPPAAWSGALLAALRQRLATPQAPGTREADAGRRSGGVQDAAQPQG